MKKDITKQTFAVLLSMAAVLMGYTGVIALVDASPPYVFGTAGAAIIGIPTATLLSYGIFIVAKDKRLAPVFRVSLKAWIVLTHATLLVPATGWLLDIIGTECNGFFGTHTSCSESLYISLFFLPLILNILLPAAFAFLIIATAVQLKRYSLQLKS